MSIRLATDTHVLVVGDIMTDIIVRADGPPVLGSDRRAKISVVEGGSAANQAAWLAAAGVPVSLFARVAAVDAESMRTHLATEGVKPLIIGDAHHKSGRLVTLIGPEGERSFFTDRGANLALSLADLPHDWHESVGLLVLSGYSFFEEGSRTSAIEIIASARERQVPTVLDAASAGFLAECGGNAFRDWTRGVDLLVANGDEAALLSDRLRVSDQLTALLEVYPMVAVKLGSEGSLFCQRGEQPIFAPGVPAEAVDTTGAGDAFLAGFIAAWRQGGDMAECLAAGNRVGAVAIQHLGGRPPKATKQET